MSCGIQAQLTLNDPPLFAEACEEGDQQDTLSSSLNNASGSLKSGSKHYSFTPLSYSPCDKKIHDSVLKGGNFASKQSVPEKPSPMQLARTTANNPPALKAICGETKATGMSFKSPMADVKPTSTLTQTSSTYSPHAQAKSSLSPGTTMKTFSRQSTKETHQSKNQRTLETPKERCTSLSERKWSSEETHEWWEARYHQKERQGDGHKGQDQHENHEQEEEMLRVTKKGCSASRKGADTNWQTENDRENVRKPLLAPPKMGVFALYYILTKMGIQSDGVSNFSYKKEIELVDAEVSGTHKKRLEELKEAIKKEDESTRWGVAAKVFSWMTSIVSMISGILMIATGVGVVAGAMLLIGGMIQVSNQIMELTGGWQKIAALLPGEDTEKKGAVVAWMQIGVAVLCLILAGTGAIWGGYTNFGEVASTASALMNAIATMGHGVTTIGQGINVFMFKNKLSEIKQFEYHLARLKHMRQDLMEKVEWGVDRLEKLFEDLAKALEFDEELFYADQMLYRR